jgi:hypothetical protein
MPSTQVPALHGALLHQFHAIGQRVVVHGVAVSGDLIMFNA